MEHRPESDRPLKRVKYQQHDNDTIPVNIAAAHPRDSNNINRHLATGVPLFDNPIELSVGLTSPSQVPFNLATEFKCCWGPTFSVVELTFHAVPQPCSHQAPQPTRLPHLLPAVPAASTKLAADPQGPESHEPVDRTVLISPFTDREHRVSVSTIPRFLRPKNGQINGYVKFNWPSRQPSRRPSTLAVPPSSNDGIEDVTTDSTQLSTVSRRSSVVTLIGPMPAPYAATSMSVLPVKTDMAWTNVLPQTMATNLPTPPQESALQAMTTDQPRMLPPQFGFQAKMDRIDRRLFEFYTKNWCPGRSILNHTNLWLRDLAPMHKNEGILYAIQSLAGVYIYDYLPDELIRQRINERYVMADEYFSKLLVAPESRRIGGGDEVITMAVILSMQDIVLTERRLKKPSSPRWLEGFKQGEYLLHKTDPGCRFWKDHNVQYSDLRISQSIIVGRAVILAQPMMALPSPATLKPEEEAGRFGWLLYGTEKDMFEIHGGCGFSKKLLHTMSQVTYCAARLQQEPNSTIVPITARYLHRQLQEMRQWSREGISWEDAQTRPPTIEWVRSKSDDTIIDSNREMTDVTAEAWRIAAIIYLQCRLLRLPRNHPGVLANLTDLAKCIRIMPTSGSHFTAQAPLLPVFFLGMLATLPDHKNVSRDWFEEVVRIPVRSSVPPLYQALKRIWAWIDTDVRIPSAPTALFRSIGKRYAWWESLVASVHVKEKEILCLT
ncbi:fungal-specific transcription factor domain-containing protein [Fusarium solani]|uniref:Fungal-specific transcription factor domain-containing protein n=1 Tax=Fusarium solani TaxID=169388 RepID=A0A9P9K0R8_FUSSL|nr:fungal-specific transcription factor domain-containing protein [Fusarium solani]KAH7243913.1 fungal-specific transcription factor domain-containing protein [Fusarium solani]